MISEKWKQLVKEFGSVCKRMKFRVNESKSKVMKCTRIMNGRKVNVVFIGNFCAIIKSNNHNMGSVICNCGKLKLRLLILSVLKEVLDHQLPVNMWYTCICFLIKKYSGLRDVISIFNECWGKLLVQL